MNTKNLFLKLFSFSMLIAGALSSSVNAQSVAIDNWYNKETNAKTGKPYHYLWTDTASSGYSRWGKIFTDKGAKIKTIEKPNDAILKTCDVYIIVDPDTTSENSNPNLIEQPEIDAIDKFVRLGGVLVIMANDGPNCEFDHLNRLCRKFGISFDHVTLHPVTGRNFEMGASTNLPNHPIFKGVNKIYIKEISSITLRGVAKPILVENDKVLMAEVKYGRGMVIAVGDPWIYNEYIDNDKLPVGFENRKAATNLTDYILSNSRK